MHPTLTAIVTAHIYPPSGILLNLAMQSVPPTDVLVAYSDLPARWTVPPMVAPVTLLHRRNDNDFGYAKRQALINGLTDDDAYVGFFCHDDTYDRTYIERMLAEAAEGADVVYSSWNDIPECAFAPCSSTLGNFIVRARLLKRVGGFTDMGMADKGNYDAVLIERLARAAINIRRVNDVLYHHNVPFLPNIRPSVWGVIQ